jgi:glycosyltransferase involved in cell wall biosynthesis
VTAHRGAPRSVLIVEENAHWLQGHFPVRFAQLAEGYVELGYRVEVLTTWGWVSADETPDPPFIVHRFGWSARQLRRVAARLRAVGTTSRARRLGNHLGDALALLAMVGAVRARRRRMHPTPDVTVIFGWFTEPTLVAATIGSGHWLLNQFMTPEEVPRWDNEYVARTIRHAAQRADRRRRSAGGRFRIAAADETWIGHWAADAPFLDPIVLPIAGTRVLPHTGDARVQLGLDPAAKVALVFGHEGSKHPEVAVDAFRQLEEWTLVIAGRIADGVDAPRSDEHDLVLIPGHVDNTIRDLLLSTADLMVLSFERDYRRNSGTLMDALSAGVPVVCSGESAAAEIVDRYRLGALFTPGDAQSLLDAVRRVPDHIQPEDLARARAELSNRAVARSQLLAVGIEP